MISREVATSVLQNSNSKGKSQLTGNVWKEYNHHEAPI